MQLLNKDISFENSGKAIYLQWLLNKEIIESSILDIYEREIQCIFCLPTSVGCSINCSFCAMPYSKIPNNLNSIELWEILNKSFKLIEQKGKFQVSFMGQGEPLLNTKEVFAFCDELYKKYPDVKIGISTVGIAKEIIKLSQQPWSKNVKLQISLHAATQELREKIMAVERIHPIRDVIKAARIFSKRTKNKVCLNYVLLEGINDKPNDAVNLVKIAKVGDFYIKISKFNRYENNLYKPVSNDTAKIFINILQKNNIECKYFESVGTNVLVGCGQTHLYVEQEIEATPVLIESG